MSLVVVPLSWGSCEELGSDASVPLEESEADVSAVEASVVVVVVEEAVTEVPPDEAETPPPAGAAEASSIHLINVFILLIYMLPMYEYKYFICALDEKNTNIKELEELLKDGWEPLRETAMPSSGSNYSENAQPPTCLCVLQRKVSAITSGE